jgi:hypothetical protein
VFFEWSWILRFATSDVLQRALEGCAPRDDHGLMKLIAPVHPIISIRPLLVLSTLIRLVLVLYSEWHDRHSLVKYTDVDYLVFTDATSYTLTPGPLNHAQGPLGKWVNIGE